MPVATTVIMPVEGSIVVMPVLLLVQVPPVVASVRVAAAPVHSAVEPAMALTAGTALTVKVVVAAVFPQVLLTVYDIVVVPEATAVTAPVVASIVAAEVLVLVHVPPAVKSDRVVEAPAHNVVVPLITPGVAGVPVIVATVVVNAVPQVLLTV